MVLTAYRQEKGLVSVKLPSGVYIIDGQQHRLGYKSAHKEVILEEASILMGIERLKDDNTKELVHIQIEGEYVHDHPFITAMRKMGGDLNNGYYEYPQITHVVARFKELMNAAGWVAVDSEQYGPHSQNAGKYLVDRGTLEFAKIYTASGMTYVTSVMPEISKFNKSIVMRGSYEQMLARFTENDQTVTQAVRTWLARDVAVKHLSADTIGDLHSNICASRRLLAQIDSMKKTTKEYNMLRDLLFATQNLIERNLPKT